MKILFTILSIEDDAKMYLTSAKTLTQEILNQTNHDVLISTNNVDFFSDIQSNRVIVRDNILKDSNCASKVYAQLLLAIARRRDKCCLNRGE